MAAVAAKDLRSELRTRFALNSLAMVVVVTVGVLVYAVREEVRVPVGVASGMLWVSMFFTSVTGLGRTFVSEEERGTVLLLRLTTSAIPVYFGKLLVNLLLAIGTNLMVGLLYLFLSTNVSLGSPFALLVVLLLCSIGFAASLTIVSAIIARSSSKSALFPVLCFPILLPLMVLGIDLLGRSFAGAGLGVMAAPLLLLFLYAVLVVVASYILFDFLWKE
ncbi:MAG: ABC transporter permease [Chlorobi bacterium CHB2]|nr:ABC transporter permease [Chlorobi bacterium CHB2]